MRFPLIRIHSEVVHNVKLVKTKKLFAFPKRSKHLQSTSAKSTSPPFNVSHFLTAVSLAQIQQMISFLVLDQSNGSPFSVARPEPEPIFNFHSVFAQTSSRRVYFVGPVRWHDRMSCDVGSTTTIQWISMMACTLHGSAEKNSKISKRDKFLCAACFPACFVFHFTAIDQCVFFI